MSVLPPPEPAQVQSKLPAAVLTTDGVPCVHKAAAPLGAVAVSVPLADPHAPLTATAPPTPVSVMVCVTMVGPTTGKLKLSLNVPVAVGANSTVTVQLAPLATVVLEHVSPTIEYGAAKAFEPATCPMSMAVPAFVRVMTCCVVDPTVCELKSCEVGDTLNCGTTTVRLAVAVLVGLDEVTVSVTGCTVPSAAPPGAVACTLTLVGVLGANTTPVLWPDTLAVQAPAATEKSAVMLDADRLVTVNCKLAVAPGTTFCAAGAVT